MAYNLESLVTILKVILQPDQQRWTLDQKRPQIESLLEKASSLKQVLGKFSPGGSRIPERLESQIRDAAYKAEDIIESHMVDQMLSEPGGKSFTISPPDLQQAIEELDSAMHDLKMITDGSEMVNTSLAGGVSLTPDPSSKDTLVGLDKDILDLRDRLTGDQKKLEITPIVGMGGIGKTTLARNLYNDQHIVSHFDTCGWITISQDYNVKAILLGLLGCIIGKLSDEQLQKKDSGKLGLMLYQSLSDKKYLVVLDDMWSTSVWDHIKMFFPKDNSGSRIIITTRELDVANYVDSSSRHHRMHLLDESESWDLLQQKVFGKGKCPIDLECIGKQVASSCGGLPLAIHVIGGLLFKSERTRPSWEHVAHDIRVAIGEKGEHVLDVLSLSYNHLPNHLKPCFLYMGAFPEDYEIRASKLIRLWVAERFLKSNGDKSLEEEAEDYLKALVDRNLIVVTQQKSNGKAKSYSMHDLLRELCIKKGEQEKFLFVTRQQLHNPSYRLRRVSVHPSACINAGEEFMFLARSFLCVGRASRAIVSPLFSELRLLRVLDVFDIEFYQFPTEILQLVNLCYLAFSCHDSLLPSSISRLGNLQTFIVQPSKPFMYLPSEIWEMSELRHIKLKKAVIYVDPQCEKNYIQEKLQTISFVNLFYLLASNFLGSIPNIKNLGIYTSTSPSCAVDLCHLHKLETLKCSSSLPPDAPTFLSKLIFPPSLRKLSLSECTIPWGFMTTVTSLTNLEVLKICKCAFEGQESQPKDEEEWEATEEEFCSLQFLLLENVNLVHWRADKTNFPRLRHLVIRGCSALKEIPCGIGETLELIEVYESSPSVVDSANQIQVEQREWGNDDVEVRIR